VTLVGLFQMIVLFTNALQLRVIAAVLSMFTFVTISAFMVCSNMKNTASPIYLIVAFCAWLGYNELIANMKEEKTCK